MTVVQKYGGEATILSFIGTVWARNRFNTWRLTMFTDFQNMPILCLHPLKHKYNCKICISCFEVLHTKDKVELVHDFAQEDKYGSSFTQTFRIQGNYA